MKWLYLVCINDSTEEAYTTKEIAEARVKEWKKLLGEPEIGRYKESYVHILEIPLVR